MDLIGKKIMMIEMKDDPHPIPHGTLGVITHVGFDVINVSWENGRNLGVVMGHDVYQIVDDLPPNNNLVFSGNV